MFPLYSKAAGPILIKFPDYMAHDTAKFDNGMLFPKDRKIN